MMKTSDLKISKPMFAVNLAAWSCGDLDGYPEGRRCTVAAVWFQRKRHQYNGPMRTAACGGYLHRRVEGATPVDAVDMLSRPAVYSHYADCLARWDGSTLWSLEDEDTRAEYKRLLVPMLEAYPAIPASFDGWWWNG
jgi:hypothetical protein